MLHIQSTYPKTDHLVNKSRSIRSMNDNIKLISLSTRPKTDHSVNIL